MFRSILILSMAALVIGQAEAQIFNLKTSDQSLNPVPSVEAGVVGFLLSFPALRYSDFNHRTDDQVIQTSKVASFHWQEPLPFTLCSRQSLQAFELSEIEVLNIQLSQKEVQGQFFYCVTARPVIQDVSSELYVDIDNQGQIDLEASVVEIGGREIPLSYFGFSPKKTSDLPSFNFPGDLFGVKESLKLDLSGKGVQGRQTPIGEGGASGGTSYGASGGASGGDGGDKRPYFDAMQDALSKFIELLKDQFNPDQLMVYTDIVKRLLTNVSQKIDRVGFQSREDDRIYTVKKAFENELVLLKAGGYFIGNPEIDSFVLDRVIPTLEGVIKGLIIKLNGQIIEIQMNRFGNSMEQNPEPSP